MMFFAFDFATRYAATTVLGISVLTVGLIYLVSVRIDSRKIFTRFKRAPSFSQETEKATVRSPEKQNYVNTFPPSQRATLVELGPQYAGVTEVDLAVTPKPVLNTEANYRAASPSQFNFSGFSVDDIHSLGDFPDYATLSGVPLPSPLENFNIDKAVPRPYRPFRWAYHQTMCKSLSSETFRQLLISKQKSPDENGHGLLDRTRKYIP